MLSFVCCCSPMSLKLLISWAMSLLIGALGSGASLSCVFVVHSRVCIDCAACAAERDCWARVDTRNVFGAIDYCVLFSLVYGGLFDLGEQRVLLAVGTCRAGLLNTRALLFILGSGNKDGPARHQRCCCVMPKIERDRGAMRILGLVTLRLVSFFRRRRFDLCNQVSICMSSALHSFSGIIKLADHLAWRWRCQLPTTSSLRHLSTLWKTGTTRTAVLALTLSHVPFFYYLEVAPAFVVRRLCGLVCGTNLSLCNATCCHFVFNLQSHAACYLALVSLSVCDLLYSCSTVPCRSVIEVVPCF